MAVTYVTANEANIQVTLAGVTWPASLKQWTTYAGGDPTAATSQLQPGGINNAVAVPGPTTRSNVTVTAPYTWDIHAMRTQIEAQLNQAMTAGYTPTDANGNTNSNNPTTRNGLLAKAEFPQWDAKNGEGTFFTLTMECNY